MVHPQALFSESKRHKRSLATALVAVTARTATAAYFTVCISVCIRRKGPNAKGIGPLSRRRSRARKTSGIKRKTTAKTKKGVDLMLYKEMLLIGEDYDYFIEMDPAGNGIRFMRVGDDDIRK